MDFERSVLVVAALALSFATGGCGEEATGLDAGPCRPLVGEYQATELTPTAGDCDPSAIQDALAFASMEAKTLCVWPDTTCLGFGLTTEIDCESGSGRLSVVVTFDDRGIGDAVVTSTRGSCDRSCTQSFAVRYERVRPLGGPNCPVASDAGP